MTCGFDCRVARTFLIKTVTLARLIMHKLCPHCATQKGDSADQFPGARTWDNAMPTRPMLHSNERLVAGALMHALL
jgi:hypothetical protein